MKCPHCGAAMHTDRTHADWACACGLAGPRDVLEGLAARLSRLGAANTQLQAGLDQATPMEERVRNELAETRACLAKTTETFRDSTDAGAIVARERNEALREVERLKSPAVVLAEAERLLREADVCNAWFESDGVALSWWVESDDEEAYDSDTSLTLAEAYASLKEAGDGRG
jgi:hypothetical protein